VGPVYDALCGPIFLPGRRAAAAAALRIGGRILELGVGTGLSFDHYDNRVEIVGIDRSEPLIAKARARLATGQYPFVKQLLLMDAQHLEFADCSFDCIVAQFVITLVAEPERVLSECMRVLKPGGQIVLVNHLYSERGIAAAVERWAAPRVTAFGLRPEFPFARLVRWAQGRGRADLVERRRINPLGLYTLVRFRRRMELRAV
jgi:ubiquinone/menaquinone biosynthesis C-methylase UbiE